jgi:hypothetical protein
VQDWAVQRLFGSQRALKTVEDFIEFEQRAAYFDGDQLMATDSLGDIAGPVFLLLRAGKATQLNHALEGGHIDVAELYWESCPSAFRTAEETPRSSMNPPVLWLTASGHGGLE